MGLRVAAARRPDHIVTMQSDIHLIAAFSPIR
jgi:hypothetical protein